MKALVWWFVWVPLIGIGLGVLMMLVFGLVGLISDWYNRRFGKTSRPKKR